MHAHPVDRRPKPRFARIIARRYQTYRVLALVVAALLLPAIYVSLTMMNRPIFALGSGILIVTCGVLIGSSVWWRRRSKQAAIGDRAETEAVHLLRDVLPHFICTENVAYEGGDMDIVLLNEKDRVVLVIEVKAYYKVDERIDDALKQARRAAYAMKRRYQAEGTLAYVVERMHDINDVFRNALIIVPLVVLPLSRGVAGNPFVFTKVNVTALPLLIDRLRSLRDA